MSSLRALLAPRVAAVLGVAVLAAVVIALLDEQAGVAVAAAAAALAAALLVRLLLVVHRLTTRVGELSTRLAGVSEQRETLRRELDARVDSVADRLGGDVTAAVGELNEHMVRLRETVSRVSSDLARDASS